MTTDKIATSDNKMIKILMNALILTGFGLPLIGNFILPLVIVGIFYDRSELRSEYLKIVTFHVSMGLYLILGILVTGLSYFYFDQNSLFFGFWYYSSKSIFFLLVVCWFLLTIWHLVRLFRNKSGYYPGDILSKYLWAW